MYDSMKFAGQEERYMRVSGRLNMLIEVSQGIATVLGGILAEISYVWCYTACLMIALLAFIPVTLMTEAPYVNAQKNQQSIREIVITHFWTCFAILRSDSRIMKIIVYYAVILHRKLFYFL